MTNPILRFWNSIRFGCRCGLGLLLLAGCGSQQTAQPVDLRVANDTLTAVLTDWQNGGTPAAWQRRSPQVIVQDLDWSNGTRLKAFQILGPGKPQDANLFCQVRLTLQQDTQPATERVVTYCVGTDPVITVFRDMMQ
jgi:hypothetical protein